MICKEDVVSWFRELESYKRIDTMCTLLNMCLPFELRFLGTVLEELGRRDSQELRGMELRVNNLQDLAADIAICQSGEPTDKKIRRKMAMFLALIRTCNRPCVNELFKTLDGWGERDFSKINDSDSLQELLLVYTMATNHPVFSFEQRSKCGEIFNKINDNSPISLHSYQQDSSNTIQQHIMQQHMISNTPPLQQQQQPHSLPQQPPTHTSQILRWDPSGFTPAPISQIISADGTPQIAIDPISQMQLPGTIPTEFTGPPPQWINARHHMQQLVPSPALDTLNYTIPPQSSSPMMSQPSSPAHSRTASPIRNSLQQQQNALQHRGSNQRNTRPNRRPSVDTTPPPTQQQQQQQTMQNVGVITSNEIMLHHNVKFEDMAFVDTFALQPQMRNGYSRPGHHTIPRKGQMQQQQQQQQHQLHFQTNTTNIYSNPQLLQYQLQNLNLGDVTQLDVNTNNSSSSRKKSGGSDSGSSIGSSGEISPPDTPHLVNNQSINSFQTYKQQKQNRINGRPDKLNAFQQGGPSNNSPQINQNFIPPNSDIIVPSTIANNNNNNNNNNSNSGNGNNNNFVQPNLIMSGSSLVTPTTGSLVNPMMLQQQPPQQYSATFQYPPHSIGTPSRPPLLPHPSTTPFRQHTQMHGGEQLLYQYPTPMLSFLPNTTSLRSSQSPAASFSISNKSSCFNCGSQSHVGRDCQEASMEDVTRGAIYKLDYNAATSSPSSLQTVTSIVSDNSAATLMNDITAQNPAANSSSK